MKDFNTLIAQDRQFKVREETFTWVDVRPEVLTSFKVDENGSDPNATWNLMDQQILLFLKPEERERWQALRAREEEPVTIAQLNAILTWLMEEQTGVPTEQPSPSEPGRGKTASSSKGA